MWILGWRREACKVARRVPASLGSEVDTILRIVHALKRPLGDRYTPARATPLVAASRKRERAADASHLRLAQRPDVVVQTSLLDSLDMIEIHGRIMLQTLLSAHHHFTRQSANGRGDRRHHRGAQERQDFLTSQYENRPPLVGRSESILPDFASTGRGHSPAGHAPLPAHPSSSSSRAATSRYPARYRLVMSSASRRFR